MSKIILTLWINRLCLISFILLCSVFRNENAFSQQHWVRDNLVVDYDRATKTVTLDFLVYDYNFALNKYGFLVWCNFEYSEDSYDYYTFMRADSRNRDLKGFSSFKMSSKKPGAKIQFLNSVKPADGKWPDDGRNIKVDVDVTIEPSKDGIIKEESKRSYLKVKWQLHESRRPIKCIKIRGNWKACKERTGDKFNEVYYLKNVESNSNIIQNDSSVLRPEISNNVKVTGETDAINVTGAEPGENIKVYTVSGVEVKSVVATDDVVNIKLPTNQIYIVKAGPERCKVAL